MVVLPVPGGPHKTTEVMDRFDPEGGLANMASGEPDDRAFCWPTICSRDLGRMRAASGPAALNKESVISQGYKKALQKLCKLSKEHFQ
jgi:hypothetical protein